MIHLNNGPIKQKGQYGPNAQKVQNKLLNLMWEPINQNRRFS